MAQPTKKPITSGKVLRSFATASSWDHSPGPNRVSSARTEVVTFPVMTEVVEVSWNLEEALPQSWAWPGPFERAAGGGEPLLASAQKLACRVTFSAADVRGTGGSVASSMPLAA